MKDGGKRQVLPLYVVVFVGFLGYSLMIATFTPMILRDDNGMLPPSSSRSPTWPASSPTMHSDPCT